MAGIGRAGVPAPGARLNLALGSAAPRQLGSRAEYIRIMGNGSKALDFQIVSRDSWPDPLVAHVKANRIFAGRMKEIGDIPVVEAASKKTPAERVEIVLERLRQPRVTKPRTARTLRSAVASCFHKAVV